MNVKRFVGKNAREAMAQVRAAWGDQAVVLSNRPIPGGVEILAMAGADVPTHPPRGARTASAAAPAPESAPAEGGPMSTVSFERFVRERQRQEALAAPQADTPTPAEPPVAAKPARPARTAAAPIPAADMPPAMPRIAPVEPARFAAQELGQSLGAPAAASAVPPAPALEQHLMDELRSMRGMIASQLASLSWFDTVRRHPVQTQLLRLMLGNGFSPVLARQLVHHLPEDRQDEAQAGQWLLEVLSHNLACAGDQSLAAVGGVHALVGPTGVGKTTTTAKIAAAFAARHGASSVGLITVDTYRMAASDQLRAFGRLLNIPVHTARDTASLVDLLDLFTAKKLVLIDTVGVGQRDRRSAELLAALPADRVQRLLVLNASAQPETLEEVVQTYGQGAGTRCVISKLDEAVKCGGAVDVAIRHRLRVEGIANGQRVPEDWHAARPQLLVQKALLRHPTSPFTPDDAELALMLTAPPASRRAPRGGSEARHA